MSAALDMTLDDIIKNNTKSGSGNSRGRTRSSGSGPGPSRRFPNRAANRAAPYATAKVPWLLSSIFFVLNFDVLGFQFVTLIFLFDLANC